MQQQLSSHALASGRTVFSLIRPNSNRIVALVTCQSRDATRTLVPTLGWMNRWNLRLRYGYRLDARAYNWRRHQRQRLQSVFCQYLRPHTLISNDATIASCECVVCESEIPWPTRMIGITRYRGWYAQIGNTEWRVPTNRYRSRPHHSAR